MKPPRPEMFSGWRVGGAALAASWVMVWSAVPAIHAHDIRADRPIRAFLMTGADRVQLLLRIPLDTLLLPLPTSESRIDVHGSTPLLDDAVAGIGRALTLLEGTTALAPVRREFRLSLPSDRSFDGGGSASALFDGAAPAPAVVYANQGYLDARLTYPAAAPGPAGTAGATIRIQSALREAWGADPKLSLTFLPAEGDRRQYTITSALGRVTLNPTAFEAARRSFVAGLRVVLESAEYLMLLACLIVPVRMRHEIVAVLLASIGGYAIAIGSLFILIRVDDPFAQVAAASIAVVVTGVALFNVVEPSFPRRWILAGVAGLVCGFAAAGTLRDHLPLAGAHLIVSGLALTTGMAAGQALAAVVLAAWARYLIHGSATERARILVVSAIVADIAWHRFIERAGPLWQAGWPHSGPSLMILARSIAGSILLMIAARYVVRALLQPHGSPRSVRG